MKWKNIFEKDEIDILEKEFEIRYSFSRYTRNDTIDILTIEELQVEDDDLKIKDLRFAIQGANVYWINADHTCEKLENAHDDLLKIMNKIHYKNTEFLSRYGDESDNLEDYLFDRDLPPHFMDMWFGIKKSSLKIDRYFERILPVLREYVRVNASFVDEEAKYVIDRYQSNANYIKGTISKLDSIHNYYTSVKNDKLNKNIYLLTLISGVFLPLNLIVGFFGMNTENLFFKGNENGTIVVTYIMLAILFISFLGLKIMRVLDGFLLKHGLGKYKLYKGFSNRFQEIEKNFDINLN